MFTCSRSGRSSQEPIEFPGRSSSPGNEKQFPEIDLPAADNASRDIPQEFPEKNNRAL